MPTLPSARPPGQDLGQLPISAPCTSPRGVHPGVGRATGLGTAAVYVVAVMSFFTLAGQGPWMPVVTLAGIYAVGAMGLVLLAEAGAIALGQAALVGVAAYATVVLNVRGHVFLLTAAIAGVVVTFVFAGLLAPVARIGGYAFSLVTLLLNVIVVDTVGQLGVTGGFNGMGGLTPLYFVGLNLAGSSAVYFEAWTLTGVLLLFMFVLRRSQFGRDIEVVRHGKGLAAACGIDVGRLQMTLWLIAGIFAGVCGALFAVYSDYVTPGDFGLTSSIFLVAAAIVAGRRYIVVPIAVVALQAGQYLTGSGSIVSGPELAGIILVIGLPLSRVNLRRPGCLPWRQAIGRPRT